MVRSDPQIRGVAALETAIALPVFIALALGLVQLTLLAHAKLMVEYAAFFAARAGIVWNGNNERMRDAALFALLPMHGRTDDLANLVATLTDQRVQERAFRQLPWGSAVPNDVNGAALKGLVRVDLLHPTQANFDEVARERGDSRALDEIDFDQADSAAVRRAGLLKVRLRYWYELKIPLANWLLFVAWYASNAGVRVTGELHHSRIGSGGEIPPPAPGIAHRQGYPTVSPSEMRVLWDLATGRLLLPGRTRPRVFLPVTATYSLSMQSNLYRKWLMR
jgi:hypothetical protein